MKFIADLLRFLVQILPLVVELIQKHEARREERRREPAYTRPDEDHR